MTPFEISARFFLQLAVIIAACRLVGWFARRLGQPQVVGEMIAGVLLGPSVFGALAPAAQSALFPAESKPVLFTAAQLGLVLYMFLVGVEFDPVLIRRRLRGAAAVSLSGILAPLVLGAAAAWWLAPHWPLFTEKTARWQQMLFMGAAMSITAFPMLARIIYERGLAGTSLGVLALAAGAIDDAAAWCVLAIVLAGFSGHASVAVTAILGALVYVAVVVFAGAPLLRLMAKASDRRGGPGNGTTAAVLCLLMLGAWFTDAIGIYAVFGAFLLGVAMPKGTLADALHAHFERLTTTLLLPMFFVYSGLNTKLGLLLDPGLAGVTLLLLATAVLGKGAACALAARLHGETPRDAFAIGALMNARGLMELIILNIGLERGVITPTLFTMLVLMAVVTTLMATPAFELVRRKTSPA